MKTGHSHTPVCQREDREMRMSTACGATLVVEDSGAMLVVEDSGATLVGHVSGEVVDNGGVLFTRYLIQ